jgi:DNA (cytosine-5)-methyltransferase 1
MGVELVEPDFNTLCYVEWEEYPRSVLIDAQRDGYLRPAPIWDDLTTFDARPLAGAIDPVLAGYPCQPFSQAGQRRGENDERHLWPDIVRIIKELGDDLQFIILENVSGYVTLGAETVLRDLWAMGFTPAAGIFSAEEVGASHERQRWFCVAHRESNHRRGKFEADGAGRGRTRPARGGSKLADPDGRNTGAEWEQRGWEQRLLAKSDGARRQAVGNPKRIRRPQGQPEHELLRWRHTFTGAGCKLDDASGPRCLPERIWPNSNIEGWECLSSARRDELADTIGATGHQRRHRAGGETHQERETSCLGPSSKSLFPPGPSQQHDWFDTLGMLPDLAPSLSRSDIAKTARKFGEAISHLNAQEGSKSVSMGVEESAKLPSMGKEAEHLVGLAQAQSDLRRMADGVAKRSRALKLLGNGVCPLEAGHAIRTLLSAHGIVPVDLAATVPITVGTVKAGKPV